jgi:predicted CXXCH cytochrome family protein
VASGYYDKIGQVYDGGALGWGANIGNALPGATNISLANDHPTSFTWVEGVTGRTDAEIGFSDTTVKLFNIGGRTKMECSTCHNVHDKAIEPFLRMSNAGSAMCLRCHNK